jgi:hypothetical protein
LPDDASQVPKSAPDGVRVHAQVSAAIALEPAERMTKAAAKARERAKAPCRTRMVCFLRPET